MNIMHWFPAYRAQLLAHAACQMLVDAGALNREGIGYMPWWTDSSDLPRARNEALQKAVDEGFEYIAMQDSDIYCPAGSPLKMLVETAQETGAALVGAICGLRRIRLEQVAPNVRPFRHGEVYRGDRVGTGLVLIDARQVSQWAETYHGPWFARTYHDERQTQLDFGEDFFFSAICHRMGGTIWIDGRVETIHAYTDHKHLHYRPEGRDSAACEPIAVTATTAQVGNHE